MNRAEKAQERRQEGTRRISGIMGAESRECRSAAHTGGASDLPELRSQEEIDEDLRAWPPGWWILPGALVGLAVWAAVGVMIVWRW